MENRKYLGVPTQEEIIKQYNDLVELTKDIKTIEQIQNFEKEHGKYVYVEVNYDILDVYNNEPIEVIRYDYENILVYANIKDNEIIHSPYITLYSDDGLQFGTELFNDYSKEIERVYKMGLLQLA